jgi:hypothetical protein
MVNAQQSASRESANPSAMGQRASDLSGAVADQVKRGASEAGGQARQFINDAIKARLSVGTDLLETIAESARAAASKLQDTSPQVASLVQTGADRVEDFSQSVKDRSPEELLEAGLEFSRRNPAVVFGAAFAAAMIATRVLAGSSRRSIRSPSRASSRAQQRSNTRDANV